MRFMVCTGMLITLLLVPACTQATPESSPTLAPSPTREATPIPTGTPERPSATPQPTATSFPTSTPTTQPTSTSETTEGPGQPEVYVTVEQITGYSSPGGEEFGYIIPGKKFTILERQDAWLNIRLLKGAEGWIQTSKTAYYPEGQVPPTPTEVPPSYCEGPHWPNRTPDRKTGIICDLSKWGCYQYIHDPGDVTHRYFRPESGSWTDDCWARSARITDIDRQTGTITFDVGGGLAIRRFFTRSTWIQMWVHEYTKDMLLTGQECPFGGNLCDLEVGDAARIYFKTEEQARAPDPAPSELLLLTIVQ
jgi:hypothetical protein